MKTHITKCSKELHSEPFLLYADVYLLPTRTTVLVVLFRACNGEHPNQNLCCPSQPRCACKGCHIFHRSMSTAQDLPVRDVWSCQCQLHTVHRVSIKKENHLCRS